jgi:hypothetical protein
MQGEIVTNGEQALTELTEIKTPETQDVLDRLTELSASVLVALAAGRPDEASAILADYEGKLLLRQALPTWQWSAEE